MNRLLIFLILFSSCTHLKSRSCIEKKGAFDIGSGSTKAIFATINKCEGKIVKVLFEKQSPIKFKASLRRNDKKIPRSLSKKALNVLKQWKKEGTKLGITKYTAVATEVFRQATNGGRLIKKLSHDAEIPIKIITQEDEAKIGFWAGVASSPALPKATLVWDIGGASMQMSYLNTNGKIEFYLGKLASVSFKEKISGNFSPNPLTPVGATQAVIRARNLAKTDVPIKFRKSIKDMNVVGIGGVHYHSIGKKFNYMSYDKLSLKTKLLESSNMTDKQIGGAYSATEITNMALVLGYMNALNITEVKPVKANLAHGLLLMPTDINE